MCVNVWDPFGDSFRDLRRGPNNPMGFGKTAYACGSDSLACPTLSVVPFAD